MRTAALNPRSTKKTQPERKGIGLYSYEQLRNTTAFDYFGQIVIGTIVTACGGMLFYHLLDVRAGEIRRYGSAEPHVWAWIVTVTFITIGIFMAHAGVIYCARRLSKRFRNSARLSRQGKREAE